MAGNKQTVSILFILSLTFAANTSGQEKRMKKADLPTAVQKTADEQSKEATVRRYIKDTEDGKLEYEVEMIVDGHSKDVSIDPSGHVLAVEEQVFLDKLPTGVREGLQKKAGNGKLIKVESIVKHGKLVAYEAQVLTGNKRSEVQVGPDGRPLGHEE